jgi:guanosine monophosphate reductase
MYSKYLPEEFYCNNKNYIKGLYNGLIESNDIYEYNCNNTPSLNFYDKSILELFYWCCFNLNISFSSYSNKNKFKINTYFSQHITSDYTYSNFKSISNQNIQQYVWDIEVECPTHSFIANNSIVHNSVCTTRTKTGIGYPQLSAILECSEIARKFDGYIVSDGGLTIPGDFSKAFGAGANFCMSGGMFAGHLESAGEMITENEVKYKLFYGMSSKTAQDKHNGGLQEYRSSEGKTVKIKYKGPLKDTVMDIFGGIRSTCTYIGAKCLEELYHKCTFIRCNRQLNTVYGNGT